MYREGGLIKVLCIFSFYVFLVNLFVKKIAEVIEGLIEISHCVNHGLT